MDSRNPRPFAATDAEAYSDPSASSGTSPPAPDRDDAEKFIAALAGSVDAKVTFQTFHETNKAKGGANIFHGSLAEHWSKLVDLNGAGHGVYVLVNQGDGNGRKAANVVGLRALFLDDDGKGAQPASFGGAGVEPFTALPPTITVQSKAGQHNYFQLAQGEPLDQFTAAQQTIAAHFGTDSAVKDLARVMRVPGFLHMKDPANPYLVTVVQVRAERYTIAEVLAAYPAPMPEAAKGASETVLPALDRRERNDRARKYVAKVPPAVAGEEGDVNTFRLCATLARGFDLTDEECMVVLPSWNARCQPPWSDDELRQKIANGRQHGTEEIGGMLRAKPKPSAGANTGVHPTEFAALCDILRDAGQRQRAIGRAGELEMDVRTRQVTLDRKPFGHDVDLNVIRENLTKQFRPIGWSRRFEFTKEAAQDAMSLVASEKSFHPVQEYLTALKWDGQNRLALLASRVLGLEVTDRWSELNAVLLKRWFVSAVARAMRPGCKVDTVLILVGKQGRKKSTFFSVLGGDWFTDSPLDMEGKDGMLLLGKTWIYELGELDSMARARNQTAVKAFISRQVDDFRPPYARSTVAVPRTSVFVGTTNEDDFLTDSTGNRRYWPISGCNKTIDIDLLREWRDQLWAQAVQLYRDGEQWFLTDEEETRLTEKLRDHEKLDPWHEAIAAFVEGKAQVRTLEVLTHLQVPRERQTRAEDMRVAHTLKLLGFRAARVGAKRERVWQPE